MLSGRLRARLIRLIGDREGVSAIEFSVIAPILLLILIIPIILFQRNEQKQREAEG